MASHDIEELFESLPEQAAPERASRRCPRLRIAERRQVELRAVTLDDLVPDDHRVRLVWRFVEELDLTALHATIKAVEGQPDIRPADSCSLVAVCDDRGHWQCPGGSTPVSGAHRLSVAVWWCWHERQDPRGLSDRSLCSA